MYYQAVRNALANHPRDAVFAKIFVRTFVNTHVIGKATATLQVNNNSIKKRQLEWRHRQKVN